MEIYLERWSTQCKYVGHLKSKASLCIPFSHCHGLSHLIQGMVLDQRLQYHSKEYIAIYIHISFKIMFKSFTTENLASTWKHFSFSRLYTCMEEGDFLYIQFFHNIKINFFYIAFKLTKKIKKLHVTLYCELTPLNIFTIHC